MRNAEATKAYQMQLLSQAVDAHCNGSRVLAAQLREWSCLPRMGEKNEIRK